MDYTSRRVNLFTESIIREMTRVNNQHNAINLAQGFPDFDPPKELIEAAKTALDGNFNQYAITWGAPRLRQALAEKFAWYNGVEVHPDKHVTIACGGTEAMLAAVLAVIDPGDEVIIFEPFYENYGPDSLLSGGKPVYVSLRQVGDSFQFDRDELRRAFSKKTKAIIINTPHNPTGKVFSYDELGFIAELCQEHDALAITDEPYEHILFDGERHYSIASLPGMGHRTITVNSMSKTYSVTGWRIGWAICLDEKVSVAIRRAHDFITVGAAAPLQEASVTAFRFPRSYYDTLAADYTVRRDAMLSILGEMGFDYITPKGAYYVMTRYPDCGYTDDMKFSIFLSSKVGVTPVPAKAFYHDADLAKPYIRFAFPKRPETFARAREKLSNLAQYRRS
ncbi:MAG: aminotransferase class I/II-fold pyridoxal phosphate-dependent enzyme [SAR202 cluster bacterium]|nr:aminotransferase class I/II-fold pyridoxal phosphate-dependent enzyme [SAR202 cluster bacterium]